ncbi:hypothetical protein DCS_08253 [Drechmeria coniospora]|uniref:Cell wall protein n=1 Tax=Drechmeria coniospora TaxID=98403 RepID=A0A151GGQ3_DRECN|nr:hypothetical protein DCS_08253 [Drechmeria coniospora]KYK56283.1 hypothetical protein DCS_08253 [Drechmeria coniospora]
MKWTNALVFATTASAAALHGEGVNFDILKQVNTTLQEIITTLNGENTASTESINGAFFESRLPPLTDAVKVEARKIYLLNEKFSIEDRDRLFAPASKFPELAEALDSALKGNTITAQLAEHGGCNIRNYILGLRAAGGALNAGASAAATTAVAIATSGAVTAVAAHTAVTPLTALTIMTAVTVAPIVTVTAAIGINATTVVTAVTAVTALGTMTPVTAGAVGAAATAVTAEAAVTVATAGAAEAAVTVVSLP